MRGSTASVVLLALGLLCAPLTASVAQPATKVYRIGYIAPGTGPSALAETFRQELRDLGYVEGQNLVIEYRWAEQFERLSDLAAELVRLQVEVIFADGGAAARAAQQATDTIPIVMTGGDPVAQGLAANLARPGGNVTGVSTITVDLSQKRLEIFKEALPGMTRIAVLWCPGAGANLQQLREMHVAAHALGVQLHPLEVRGTDGFEALVEAAIEERDDGLVVLSCAIIPQQITALAAKHRLPAMYTRRGYVADGGFMSYGPSGPWLWRRAAVYVDKILQGAKPVDLPVEQPTKFEPVINLKTAKTLGLTIPPSLLLLADEVIQ